MQLYCVLVVQHPTLFPKISRTKVCSDSGKVGGRGEVGGWVWENWGIRHKKSGNWGIRGKTNGELGNKPETVESRQELFGD